MRAACLCMVVLSAVAVGCGDNDVVYQPWILPDLSPSEGLSVRTPEFEVAAGAEVQDCYFFDVPAQPGDAALWVDRTELALNAGSHHMNVFRVNTIVDLDPVDGELVELGGVAGTVIRGGECWRSSNWADWPIVANSQQSSLEDPIVEWALPAGVAMKFQPGERLMLQIHYVNAASQDTPFVGRGGINFYRSTDGDAVELGALFATQQSIRVCRSNPTPTYAGACAMPPGTHTVTAANGHFHSRGKRFQIWRWDGTSTTEPPAADRFYASDDWSEPVMETGLDVTIPDGGGIWWSCDYRWREPAEGCEAVDARDPEQAGDCCYTFGPTVETSEHCNVFAYYYPRSTEGVACF